MKMHLETLMDILWKRMFHVPIHFGNILCYTSSWRESVLKALRSPKEICFCLFNPELPTCILRWKYPPSSQSRSGLCEWVQIQLKEVTTNSFKLLLMISTCNKIANWMKVKQPHMTNSLKVGILLICLFMSNSGLKWWFHNSKFFCCSADKV